MSETKSSIPNFKSYNGNPLLKRTNVAVEWTPELVKEYIKCKEDVQYFIETYVKIINVDEGLVPFTLRDYQKEMVDAVVDNRFVVYATARQIGKSTIIAAYFLWYLIFNSEKTVAILANKEATAVEILGKVQMAYQYLPPWLQQGVKEWNKGSFVLENNSRAFAAATSSDSIRGYSLNCVGPKTLLTLRDKETGFINILHMDELEKDIMERDNSYGFVYKTTNLVNGKQYIGAHRLGNNSKYLGSGKLLLKAIKKYGAENFAQEILKYCKDEIDLFESEISFIEKYDAVNSPDFYNICSGGKNFTASGDKNPFFGKDHTEETKKRISELHKGKVLSEEQKRLISEAPKERWRDPEYRERVLAKRRGQKRSEETKRKMSLASAGRKHSEESKKKMSESRKKYWNSEDREEHKQSIRNIQLEYVKSDKHRDLMRERRIMWNKSEEKKELNRKVHTGAKRSEETKKKISLALRNRAENDISG